MGVARKEFGGSMHKMILAIVARSIGVKTKSGPWIPGVSKHNPAVQLHLAAEEV